jgi:hypothetical protein
MQGEHKGKDEQCQSIEEAIHPVVLWKDHRKDWREESSRGAGSPGRAALVPPERMDSHRKVSVPEQHRREQSC